MKTIQYYEIVLSVYRDEPVGRIRFINHVTNEIEETNIYVLHELNNIIMLWKQGELLGSFGVGTILASDATFILCEQ